LVPDHGTGFTCGSRLNKRLPIKGAPFCACKPITRFPKCVPFLTSMQAHQIHNFAPEKLPAPETTSVRAPSSAPQALTLLLFKGKWISGTAPAPATVSCQSCQGNGGAASSTRTDPWDSDWVHGLHPQVCQGHFSARRAVLSLVVWRSAPVPAVLPNRGLACSLAGTPTLAPGR